MFKSQQYHANAAEYGELVRSSTGSDESRKFEELQDRLTSLADNEQGLADDFDNAVLVAEQDRCRGVALADEEERVLRCLGAAIIMQWNALPTTLQREIFDTAGSVGKLFGTTALRGQIARFLHKHKNDPKDGCRDARLDAAAFSRWDNEGGAVRDESPNEHPQEEKSDVTYTTWRR
jgi:hypothetical protein